VEVSGETSGGSTSDVAGTYRQAHDKYVESANELKEWTGPFKAARDALVTAIADFTYSFFEGGGGGNGQVNATLTHPSPPPANYYKAAVIEAKTSFQKTLLDKSKAYRAKHGNIAQTFHNAAAGSQDLYDEVEH